MPEELRYLWEWYCEMRTCEALTFTEMHHWADLTCNRLLPWEVDLLRSVDRAFWRITNE